MLKIPRLIKQYVYSKGIITLSIIELNLHSIEIFETEFMRFNDNLFLELFLSVVCTLNALEDLNLSVTQFQL